MKVKVKMVTAMFWMVNGLLYGIYGGGLNIYVFIYLKKPDCYRML